MSEQKPAGKNIILCSDGTGNSGGKGNGTNVWRIFEALDLSGGRQVAFHDDGVGTQDFKLFKAIGGATGWGLGRNIRELYASLVRVYDDGDRIYLFGFSRGAYTVRSLANLIHRCGILDRHAFDTPDDLEREIFRLYDAYRRLDPTQNPPQKLPRTPPANYWRDAEDVIAFIGVWDTVDAIGVPFDGLREWFRKYMPWNHHAYELNPWVKSAFHALAIDDERKSFHPLLFDESEASIGGCQVEQVWFSGVHSNVGGGYPKDQIAYTSLHWMMRKAANADYDLYDGYVPLRFHNGARKQYDDAANPHGKLYDSRSGAMAYYRYSPRDIAKLCASANAGPPKIHDSVFVRITRRTGGYAPCNIPLSYEVSEPRSSLGRATPADRSTSTTIMQRAKDLTGRRRILYFLFLTVSALFLCVVVWQAMFPLEAGNPASSATSTNKFLKHLEAFALLVVGALESTVKAFTPDFLAGAIDAAFSRVGWLMGFGGIFGLLIWRRQYLKKLVGDLAGLGWRAIYLESVLQQSAPANGDKAAQRQQQRDKLQGLKSKVEVSTFTADAWAGSKMGIGKLVRAVFSVSLVAVGTYLVGWYHPESDWSDACSVPKQSAVISNNTWLVPHFRTSDPCYRTGIQLQMGTTYSFRVKAAGWADANIPAGPDGFVEKPESLTAFLIELWRPMLRAEGTPYFVMMGQIVGTSKKSKDTKHEEAEKLITKGDPFEIGSNHATFSSPASGKLILFVNDVLCRLCPPGTFGFYANNKGTAAVTIQKTK